MPAIEVLKDRLNVVSLNSDQDYRLINTSINQLFIVQQADSQTALDKIFAVRLILIIIKQNSVIEICTRKTQTIKCGNDIVWFDFSVICGNMRSQLDYLN